MILLDALILPDLVRGDDIAWTGVAAEVDTALDGTPVVWEGSRAGRPIDLAGGADTGWISREALLILRSLASVPGATYVLDYEGEAFRVRFRHEDAPVIQATALVPRPNAAPGDWYTNVLIKLMEV
jgi:hypothetical protein